MLFVERDGILNYAGTGNSLLPPDPRPLSTRNGNDIYARERASGERCLASARSCLRKDGQSYGNENDDDGTRERGSVNTDTGLYSSKRLSKRV